MRSLHFFIILVDPLFYVNDFFSLSLVKINYDLINNIIFEI